MRANVGIANKIKEKGARTIKVKRIKRVEGLILIAFSQAQQVGYNSQYL